MSDATAPEVAPLEEIASDDMHVVTRVPEEMRGMDRTLFVDPEENEGTLVRARRLLDVLNVARHRDQLILLHAGTNRWLWLRERYCRALYRHDPIPMPAVPTRGGSA